MLGVLGDLVEDVVVWLDEPTREGTDTEVSLNRRRGGSGANVAAFAASRHPTRFLGCVGPDAVGDALVAELAAAGVDVRVQRRGCTGTIVVFIDDRGERSMFPDRGAAPLAEHLDEAWISDLTHLHLPAYCFAAEPMAGTARGLARRMHRQDATVSVDASSTGMLRRYGQHQFLELVADLAPALLFANRDEADLLGLAHGNEPGPELAAIPQTTAVVKDGDRPSTVFVPGDRPVQVPVAPVRNVRDLTGAGDAFAAGFLAEFLARGDLTAACEAGHATAAAVLHSPGASIRPS